MKETGPLGSHFISMRTELLTFYTQTFNVYIYLTSPRCKIIYIPSTYYSTKHELIIFTSLERNFSSLDNDCWAVYTLRYVV